MRTIPLHGKKAAGRVVLIDDEDYELISPYNWHIYISKTAGPYASGQLKGAPSNAKQIFMHNLIMGAIGIDHANHDGLDSRRENLRVATKTQNMRNKLKRPGTKSPFEGVRRRYHRWNARIAVDGKQANIGSFASELEAARAYDDAARRLFGEFACLNFPEAYERGARPAGGVRSLAS